MFNFLPLTVRYSCQRFNLLTSCRCLHATFVNNYKDYYAILGVPKNASEQQIKSAYYAKAKIYHPDTNKGASDSKKFQEITDAYDILGDETKRRAYDSVYRQSSQSFIHNKNRPQGTKVRTQEPINMNHINRVYKALNNEEEEPKFRPFEDHRHANSEFNRFEYTRHYDAEARAWVYRKHPKFNEYRTKMKAKAKILNMCVSLFTATIVIVLISSRI